MERQGERTQQREGKKVKENREEKERKK